MHLAMKNGEVLVVKVESAAEGTGSSGPRGLRRRSASSGCRSPARRRRCRAGRASGARSWRSWGRCCCSRSRLAQSVREMMRYVDTGQMSGFTVLVTAVSLLAFAVYAVASALRRREAVVGTDGIAYRKTFSTEFIPYGSLTRVVARHAACESSARTGGGCSSPRAAPATAPCRWLRPPPPRRRRPRRTQRVLSSASERRIAKGATDLFARGARPARSQRPCSWARPGATTWASSRARRRLPQGAHLPDDLGAVIEDSPRRPSGGWRPRWPCRRGRRRRAALVCASPAQALRRRGISVRPRSRPPRRERSTRGCWRGRRRGGRDCLAVPARRGERPAAPPPG